MYRTSTASCPACGGRLTVLKSTLQASGCEVCGGLLLGPEAAVHVMKGLGDALETEMTEVGARHERTSVTRAPFDAGVRECPSCGNLMMRVVIGHIVVETCAAHGTWFDREELGAVVDVCRDLKRVQLEGESLSAEDIAMGGVRVVAGLFTVTWSIATAVLEAIADPDRNRR